MQEKLIAKVGVGIANRLNSHMHEVVLGVAQVAVVDNGIYVSIAVTVLVITVFIVQAYIEQVHAKHRAEIEREEKSIKHQISRLLHLS